MGVDFGGRMVEDRLNPAVRFVRVYERVNRKEEAVAYDCRLIYVDSGDLTATVGGKSLGHLGAGDMLFIPAGVTYKLRGQYVRFIAAAFDLFGDTEPRPATAAENFDATLLSASECAPYDSYHLASGMEGDREELFSMCHVFLLAEGNYRAELSARMKLILLKISEAANENALPSRMAVALGEYIRDNIGGEISNTEVAANFGYHPFYVSNVLKSAKGQTLRQYIISYRLKLAKSMLECTGKALSEIAEDCGFTDASYFTKTFRQTFGETPKEYRNRFKDDFI